MDFVDDELNLTGQVKPNTDLRSKDGAKHTSDLLIMLQSTEPVGPVSTGIEDLLIAFRTHYYRFETSVREALTTTVDTFGLQRLGDEIDDYAVLVNEVSISIFSLV